MPNPKVHVAYSRSRLWVRDVLVAGLLATLCLLLADRVRPPMESPLNRAASGASIAAGKNRSREVVTTAENALRRTGTTALGNTRPVADNAALDQAQHTVANSTSMTGQHLRIHRHRHQHLDRRMGAVLGLFLGDAAAMGLHWIYNVDEIKDLVEDGYPEFYNPPSSPFYHYQSGEQSPYGDEAMLVLQSVAKNGGVDGAAIQQELYEGFLNYKGRLNKASKDLVANIRNGCNYPNCGSNSVDAHGLVKVPIVAALYAGRAELEDKVKEAVRAHQDNPLVLSSAVDTAKLLEHVILYGSIARALDWGLQPGHLSDGSRELLLTVQQSRSLPHTVAVQQFGQTCELPGSFESDLHGVLTYSSLVEAVRGTIMAGGDNCSRAAVLAAFFAAQDGASSVPQDWKEKSNRYRDVHSLVQQMLGMEALPPPDEDASGR